MKHECPPLTGAHIRLEPLGPEHAAGLVSASAGDGPLYEWSLVPIGAAAVDRYIATAVAWREAGSAVPFATVRVADGVVIGSTRFFDIERWRWPAGHPMHGRPGPDVCEIGYTWYARSAIRTAANTEAKLLMLTHAFESWRVHRVSFHTDVRNARSRAAIERIGGQPEGILRAHRLAADFTPRESARYSIVLPEWGGVKARLRARLGLT